MVKSQPCRPRRAIQSVTQTGVSPWQAECLRQSINEPTDASAFRECKPLPSGSEIERAVPGCGHSARLCGHQVLTQGKLHRLGEIV
jgi:hypothetical protein